MARTYRSWAEAPFASEQREYTALQPLLDRDGTLLAAGWARKNVFQYDRSLVRHPLRRKEWDFYQLSDGRYMVQISFANISLGGYASAVLVDLKTGEKLCSVMAPFLGGKDRYILPERGDRPGHVRMQVGKAVFETVTEETRRELRFSMGAVRCEFVMEIAPGLESITTVLPFPNRKDCYFMTTKQNCMPCRGTFRDGERCWSFRAENTFCVMDWGRVCTPYSLVWYWGNGSARFLDAEGKEHLFGFEVTWGIGDESKATETCLFFDGKVHKLGPVDVKAFPKTNGYTKPWEFVSEDNRFRLTMTPTLDYHSDLNILVMRMHSHQVHGRWNGTVTLDDGSELLIQDLPAFCEYVENRW